MRSFNSLTEREVLALAISLEEEDARLYDDFAANELAGETTLAADFRAFAQDGGDRLAEHALLEALHQHWFGAGRQWSWSEWPAGWRKPGDESVRRFARDEAQSIRFHAAAASARPPRRDSRDIARQAPSTTRRRWHPRSRARANPSNTPWPLPREKYHNARTTYNRKTL